MKRNTASRLLSLLLAIAAALFLAVPAMADNEQTDTSVASVTVGGETTYYDSLDAAISYFGAKNGTITLLKDTALSSKTTLSGTVTLDLGGCTLSTGANYLYTGANAKITILNGTITGTSSNYVLGAAQSAALEMDKVTVMNTSDGDAVNLDLSKNITFTAKGCTFSSANGKAVSASGNGASTVDLTDCALSSAGNTLWLQNGSGTTVTIEGCNISTTNTTKNGSAIYLSTAKMVLNITDTTITANSMAYAIYASSVTSSTAQITLGKGNHIAGTVVEGMNKGKMTVSITGGYFSTDVTAYCASGCECIDWGNGSYRVVSGDALGITYNANGGDGNVTDSGTYYAGDEAIAASGDALSLAGYDFAGWNTAANGTGTAYAAGDSVPLSESVTLYAQWAEATQTAALHIYNNMILNSSLTYNFLIKQTDLPDITGYTLTVNGAALTLQEGTAGTIYAGYWVAAYNFYACDYDAELTAVLTHDGETIQTEVSYTSAADYLDSFADDENASETVKTMAASAVAFCNAAKNYYAAQTGAAS